MIKHILGEREERWREEARSLLSSLQVLLRKVRAPDEDHDTLAGVLRQLDELFLLVVVGEFNSGKSAFVNALLEAAVLEEGVLPTTTRIQVLKYGETAGQTAIGPAAVSISAPAPLLKDIHIVDTPGTNAIQRDHEAITKHFIPRADLVLFVTSADRPFTESEREFLSLIRDWGKKIVVVVNKVDILESAEDVDRVEAYVRDNTRVLLGTTPAVFPVSARLAFRAKLNQDSGALERSRFMPLEQYIRDTLDEQERVRLKLLSPLGVGVGLVDRHRGPLQERAGVLQRDVETVEQIEGQLAVYRQEMKRDFRLRLSDAGAVLHEMEARGHEFIEEVVRFARLPDLLRRERRVRIKSSQTAGAVFEPPMIEKKAGEAGAQGKEYFTWGYSFDPSPSDPRNIQFRVYQRDGRPHEIEIFVQLRNFDGTAGEGKAVRFAWPG